jgi:uncharacterized protein (DUF3820 family)
MSSVGDNRLKHCFANHMDMELNLSSSKEHLEKLANMRMPFGKYKGTRLIDLPEPYVVWFAGKGFPKGELGLLLGTLYEIKLNGLEYLVKPLQK